MKTKIKKRQGDTPQKYESELFPSMTHPLREVLDARHDLRQKNLECERVERRGLFADEVSKRDYKITTRINRDNFSLRAILCDEEAYAVLQQMAERREKKIRYALLFLRYYSLLIKNGYFEMGYPKDASAIIIFALKHVPSSCEIKEGISSGDYRPLMRALLLKVEKEIEFIKPLLKDFVQSDFFKKKSHRQSAHLASITEKWTASCEEGKKRRRIENDGELTRFSIEMKKEEAKTENPEPEEEKDNASRTFPQKAKRGRRILEMAGLLISALKIVGILIPCLALTAIPVFGFLLSLISLVILGAVCFTYYMAPHYKEEKQDKQSQKKAREEEEVSVQNRSSQHVVKEGVVRAKQKTTSFKTEKMVIASPFMDNIPPSPKDIKPSLGGGQWLKEDRKRREQSAANDKVSRHYKDNGVYQSFPNINHGRGKPM